MRIRFLEIYHRIFHDNGEEYELRIKMYGTKEELESVQKLISAVR